MNQNFSKEFIPYRQPKILRKKSPLIVHILLFIFTFITTTIAGTLWQMKNYIDVQNWHYGILYAVLIMTFLISHEFGHYIASRIHKVDASLPYLLPAPIPELMLFGTFGAIIATRSPIPNRKALFDIGISGPFAGFVVSVLLLIIGLQSLPPKDFIYTIHPEYLTKFGGSIPKNGLYFGDTLIYSLLAPIFANPNGWLPPMNEIYHYPFLCVGWFGLLVTVLNLLPFGQLDGGHILYAMFGNKQHKIAQIVWWCLVILGFGSVLNFLLTLFNEVQLPNPFYNWLQDNFGVLLESLKKIFPWYFEAWGGWLFWAIFTRIFIKIPHPYIPYTGEIGAIRKLLGWFAIIIFFLSFSFNGIYIY
ncbi:MAG: site-2 protease family protein [Candidatus Kapaibacteriales bacterium]